MYDFLCVYVDAFIYVGTGVCMYMWCAPTGAGVGLGEINSIA